MSNTPKNSKRTITKQLFLIWREASKLCLRNIQEAWNLPLTPMLRKWTPVPKCKTFLRITLAVYLKDS